MCLLSAAWNDLTEEQREAWGETARTDRRGGRAARSRRRSGRRAFFKANFHRLALRQDLLTNAIVPEEEGWHGEQKAPQTIAKP